MSKENSIGPQGPEMNRQLDNSGPVAEIGSGRTIIEGKYPIIAYFKFSHLPAHLQEISIPFCNLAIKMAEAGKSGPETAAGLRKLLEAKDCAVRSVL